jgi:hypothetical protein
LTIAEVLEVAIDAAGFFASHPAQAPVDRLALEAGAGRLDFRDDVAAGDAVAPVRWRSRSTASRTAFLQLGRLCSARLACSGGMVMGGPWMVSRRFVLCSTKPTDKRPGQVPCF